MQKLQGNNQGFTLIELMIVISIISILVAIAIPNFILYRNKAFCSSVESDANFIAAGLADYFSIPTNMSWTNQFDVTTVDFPPTTEIVLSGQNSADVTAAGLPSVITIVVTDGSSRCPLSYQTAVDGWSGALGGTFTKTM